MENPRSLSPKFKEDFAYPTVKDRLPVILTQVVDNVHRAKDIYSQDETKEQEEIKEVVGRLSKLKYELQTNKPLTAIKDKRPDNMAWNHFLDKVNSAQEEASWFSASWLYVECLFYRKIYEAIAVSDTLKSYDPFRDQKQNALTSSMTACIALAKHLLATSQSLSGDALADSLAQLIQVSLWGNKCDLSISAGVENSQKIDVLSGLTELRQRILCDDTSVICKHLLHGHGAASCDSEQQQRRVDIVLDNAGFELFTDLCLADFLIETKLCSSVHLHGKVIPWFVSDVTHDDLQWTLQTLAESSDSALTQLASRWQSNLSRGVWLYSAHDFWTLPFDYAVMHEHSPQLLQDLTSSHLVIFKGDLNYRKLTGDLKWPHETSFERALCGFEPAPLCALRTLKCDLAVGFSAETIERSKQLESDWMLTGRWGVVQFHKRK